MIVLLKKSAPIISGTALATGGMAALLLARMLVPTIRSRVLRGAFFVGATGFLSAQSSSDPALLQNAARAIAAGNLNRAQNDLQSVLRSAPNEYRALDLLGVVRVLQHREVEAEKLFVQTIQKKSDFAPGRAHLGLLYMQMRRDEEATTQLREALRLDPARRDASVALVHILQKQAQTAVAAGSPEKALTLLSEARQYQPDNPDIQFEFGATALGLALFQDAVDAFQRTLKFRENDALAIYNLGRAFMGLSKFEDAQAQFARYIELRPKDPSGYCARGMTLAALEHPAEAEVQFERSIALAPTQTESYYRLGLLKLDAKDLDSATQNLLRALDREPQHAAALTALGHVAYEQKHYADAIELLQRAISHDDSLREAHYYLGLAFARIGRKQESDQQLKIAIQLEHSEAERRRLVFTFDPTPARSATSLQK